MNRCEFTINFDGDSIELFQRALKESQKYNAVVEGDAYNGGFTIKSHFGYFAGSYAIDENVLRIALSSKPFYLPCKTIESIIREFIN
jgi:hypothetical protein